ncbi:MAG: autotransporter-associated beta strand repeat-containing protein [Pirellulales bacterium]|nr:autotransporter-associated beta strand repeat-containing protein [Pirellulales bacterium]
MATASTFAAAPLQAALTDRYWNNTGTTGDFNDGANWDIDSPPAGTGVLVTGDTAYVNNGGTANIAADVTPVLQWLYIGQGASTTGTVKQTAGAITINGSIRSIGGGGGTGTYLMEGGSLTATALGTDALVYPDYTNPFWGIGTGTGSVGAMTMKNAAVVNSTGGVRIGDTGGTGTFDMYNTSVLNQSGHFFISQGTAGVGTMTLHDSAQVITTTHAHYGGYTLVGQSGGSVGILNVLDSAKWTTGTGGNFYVGRAASTGTLNITSSSTLDPATVTVGGAFRIADGDTAGAAATGTVNMSGTAKLVTYSSCYTGRNGGHGDLNMIGQTSLTNTGDFQIANSGNVGASTIGIVTMSNNAAINQSGYVVVGANGNSASATLTMNDDATFTQSGGEVWIGWHGTSTGTLNLNGNASFENTGAQGTLVGGTSATGVLNLNGGVYKTSYLRGSANGTVNFKGGTLRSSQDETDWLGTAVVYKVASAGAKIDTPNNVRANGSLIEDGTSTGGGLTKTGAGTLTLAGTNTYTGMTDVNEGALEIAAPAALAGSATIAANATLAISTTMTLSGQVFGTAGTLSFNAGAPTLAANAFSGTLALNGGNLNLTATHSGTAYVNNGFSWHHNGTGTISGLTTVGSSLSASSADALLGGTGTLGNVAVLNNYGNTLGVKGGIEAGQNGIGSLHMANLTFNASGFAYIGNATQNIGAYTGSNAAFVAGGALTLGADFAGTVQFDLGGANVASGTYHFIQHEGAISYLNGSALSNFQAANAVLSARQTASFADNAGAGSTRYLDYVVVGAYPVWSGVVGAATNNTWTPNDHAVTNWKANTNGSAFYFIDGTDPAATGGIGDAVLFSDAAGAAHNFVDIPNNVAPISVTVDAAMTYTFNGAAGIVDGPSATKTTLLKKNAGTLAMNTPNTYSGGTTIVDGTIQVGNASAMGGGPVGFFPGATSTAILQLYGTSIAISGLTTDAVTPGTPVVENGAAGSATLTVNNATANTFAGVMQDGGSGAFSATFAGSAAYTLAGANTYSGATTIGSFSTLKLGIDNALPHGTGKGNVVFDGGTLDLNGRNQTVNGLSNPTSFGTVTNGVLASTGTLTAGDANTDSDFAGSLMDTGTGKVALAKIGSGRLALNDPGLFGGSPSNYSGGTTLSVGKIETGYDTALGTGILSMVSGTTLDLRSATLNVAGISGDGTVTTTLAANNAVLTISPATAVSTSFAGVIQNGSGTMGLTKAGAGTQTLAPATGNTYTGITTINAGTLAVPSLANGGVASPIGASTADAANLILKGGFLSVMGTTTTDRSFTANGGGITVPGASDNVTFTGTVTTTATGGYFIKNGPGTLTFNTPAVTVNDFGFSLSPAREYYSQGGTTVFTGLTGTEYKSWIFHTGTNYESSAVVNNVTMTAAAFSSGYGSAASKGVLTLTGTAQLNANLWIYVGYALSNTVAQGTLTMWDASKITSLGSSTTGRFFLGVAGKGTATLNNSSNITVPADFLCGNNTAGVGNLTLHDNTWISVGTTFYCGNGGAGTSGTAMLDGADTHITAGARVTIGNGNTASGTVTLKNASYMTAGTIAGVGLSGGTGLLTLNNNSYLTAGTRMFIGVRESGTLTNTVGTVILNDNSYLSATTDLLVGTTQSVGNVTLNGTSHITTGTPAYFGNDSSTGNATLNGGSYITVGTDAYIGRNGTAARNSVGNVTLNNTAQFSIGASNTVQIGTGAYGNGTVTLNDSAVFGGGATAVIGRFGGTGTVDVNGSAQFAATNIQVGYNWGSVVTDTHGTVNVNGAGAVATATEIVLGADGGQDGKWNQNAGQTTVATKVVIGEYDYSDAPLSRTSGAGVLNLNGGTLTAPALSTRSVVISTNAADLGVELHGATAGTVNFNGGVLKASAANADFIASDDPLGVMTLNILAGGAKIDSNGFDLTVTKALNHSGVGADGGLLKSGAGVLTLTGAVGYNGNTTVNQGTLTLAALNTPAAAVYVATGGTLNAASIAANSMTIGGAPLAAAAAVPEPGTLLLLALAGAGMLLAAWRRK